MVVFSNSTADRVPACYDPVTEDEATEANQEDNGRPSFVVYPISMKKSNPSEYERHREQGQFDINISYK